jgi:hypothetical protein
MTAYPAARDHEANLGGKAVVLAQLRAALADAVRGDHFWEGYLASLREGLCSPCVVHVVVCVEPFLQDMLDGRKSMESRFSARKIAPYRHVQAGDVLLLKRSSGPIVGLCRVRDAMFYELNPGSFAYIRAEYAEALCAQDPAFWERRRSASYATLLSIDQVKLVERIAFPKRDRRGWVVLPLSLSLPFPAET